MKEILLGLDLSTRAPELVREALAMARATSAKIHIVHAIVIPPELPTNLWGTNAEVVYATLAREARANLDRLIEPIPADLLGEVEVRVGIAWREICDRATHKNVDLIVIGAHAYGLVERTLGTTASKVVNHADRPVLVVRAKGVSS